MELFGTSVPITAQLTPLSLEIDTVMVFLAASTPPKVRALQSTVKFVKPTVEKAGEVTTEVDLIIPT